MKIYLKLIKNKNWKEQFIKEIFTNFLNTHFLIKIKYIKKEIWRNSKINQVKWAWNIPQKNKYIPILHFFIMNQYWNDSLFTIQNI